MTMSTTAHSIDRNGARTAAFYGVLLANIGSFGILFFWIIGTILLLTRNGGQIMDVALDGFTRTLYFAYPIAVIVSLAAWLLHFAKRDRAAVALAGLPIVATLLYYLYLVSFRTV